MLARENGPWNLFDKIRRRFSNGIWGELFGCVKCLGVWIAIPFAFFVKGTWIELFVIWLALAGVTALIDEWTRPPFEWQETTENGMLRRDNESSDD